MDSHANVDPNGGRIRFLSAQEAIIYNGEQFYVTRDAARTWSTVSPDIVFGDSFADMDFVNLNYRLGDYS